MNTYILVRGRIEVPRWAIATISARQSGTAGSYYPVITKRYGSDN